MAGNLIGEPFKDYVNNQIKLRQEKQGKFSRSLEEIQYLSNKNAWIKLASGVSIEDTTFELLSKNGNPLVDAYSIDRLGCIICHPDFKLTFSITI
jgi:hypothetical protein